MRLPFDAASWRSLPAKAQSLRWPGAVGAALGAAGLAVSMFVMPPLQQQHELSLEHAASLRASLAPRAMARAAATPESSALRYRDAFPEPGLRQRRVLALIRQARSSGVATRRSEFRYEAERNTGLAHYRVTMPVEGSYEQVRGFIESALRQDTAASLDSIRLRRTDTQQPVLRAELVFTLHMREERVSPVRVAAKRNEARR